MGGLDNTEVVKKLNSAEYAFYFIDQAEEVDLEQIGEYNTADYQQNQTAGQGTVYGQSGSLVP
jgi:hypothetical protein